MAEQEEVYSSKIKYDGVFSFKDLYKFCYDWLDQEVGLSVAEGKYAEKVSGTSKNIDVEWEGSKKISDYFQFKAKVKFKILALSKVEMNQGGAKISTNKGSVEIGCKGMLVRDYDGKFETSPGKKVWRAIYEKFVIPNRIKALEDMIAGKLDEFLGQAKAYLDIEGKK
jgi:hypothetical protein